MERDAGHIRRILKETEKISSAEGRAALHKNGVHIVPFREQDGVPTSFRALLLDPFCVLHFEISPLYPFAAPRVMVLTPVEHPVVAGCWLLPALAVLGEDWSPALDVSTLAVVVRSVLVEPTHEDWQTCVGFPDAVLPRGSEAEREVLFDLFLDAAFDGDSPEFIAALHRYAIAHRDRSCGFAPLLADRRSWYNTLANLRKCPGTLERDLLLLELDAGELRYRAENGRPLGVLNRLGPLLHEVFAYAGIDADWRLDRQGASRASSTD
jgi:ubiquitin-protein ligase